MDVAADQNPPFGGKVIEPEILANFELGSAGNKERKKQKTEILMLERCLELLKPGGRMGIVLPDGILTNSSLADVRQFVEEQATVTGVVSLPPHAFKPSAEVGVKTSLVFLEKKKYRGQNVGDYPTFMAIVEHVGYDSTGRDDTTELPAVAQAFLVRAGQLGLIADHPLVWNISRNLLEERLDAQFYHPRHIELLEALQNSPYKVETLGSISRKIVDGPFGSDLKVEEYVSEGIPLIRVHNVKDEKIDMSAMAYISEEKQKQLKRSRVVPGDLVLTKAGTVGMAVVVPPDITEANITSHLAKIELKEGVNGHYVCSFLNSSLGRPQLERWGNKTTRPELNTNEVRRIRVLLPPKPVQDRIAQEMAEAYREARRLHQEAGQAIATAKENIADT